MNELGNKSMAAAEDVLSNESSRDKSREEQVKNLLFILNPNAGSHTVEEFDEALVTFLTRYAEAGNSPPVVHRLIPETPDELRARLRTLLSGGEIDVVGIAGGDGSIMEVLPVMLEFPHVRMALIPFGTGNLLATNLGIPKDFVASLEVALNGESRRIDVGRIGTHYFALLAGVGTVAEIMDNTPSQHKKLLGMWAYLVDGIRSIMATRRARFKVRMDGRTLMTKGVSVVISNAASLMRPCPPLTPNAIPDDGWLDVCIVKAQSPKEYIQTVCEALLGEHVAAPTANLSYYRAKRITIDSWPRMKVQADGNIIGMTPVQVEILSRAVQVMVPPYTLQDRQHTAKVQQEGLLELLRGYFAEQSAE